MRGGACHVIRSGGDRDVSSSGSGGGGGAGVLVASPTTTTTHRLHSRWQHRANDPAAATVGHSGKWRRTISLPDWRKGLLSAARRPLAYLRVDGCGAEESKGKRRRENAQDRATRVSQGRPTNATALQPVALDLQSAHALDANSLAPFSQTPIDRSRTTTCSASKPSSDTARCKRLARQQRRSGDSQLTRERKASTQRGVTRC